MRFRRSGWAQLALDTALCGSPESGGWCNPVECVMATSKINATLKLTREAFGDRATLCYPWHPDDFDDPWEDILERDHGDGPPYPESVAS